MPFEPHCKQTWKHNSKPQHLDKMLKDWHTLIMSHLPSSWRFNLEIVLTKYLINIIFWSPQIMLGSLILESENWNRIFLHLKYVYWRPWQLHQINHPRHCIIVYRPNLSLEEKAFVGLFRHIQSFWPKYGSFYEDILMFPSTQTIYFLWGYDPGNMSVSAYLLLLSWAQFTVV